MRSIPSYNSGNLSGLADGTTFWASMTKNANGNYVTVDGYPLYAYGLTKLDMAPPSDPGKTCVVYWYDSSTGAMAGKEADCFQEEHATLCDIVAETTTDCSSRKRKKR